MKEGTRQLLEKRNAPFMLPTSCSAGLVPAPAPPAEAAVGRGQGGEEGKEKAVGAGP